LLLIGTAVFLRKCNDFGKRFSEQKQLSAVWLCEKWGGG
jgi:hypothetical protein